MSTKVKRLRAGILPYAYDDDNTPVFLLGKEIFGKWSPLAGTVEKGETPQEAAIREFTEECMGFYTKDYLEPFVKKDNLITLEDDSTFTYYYLVPFDWNWQLPYFFESVTKFLLPYTEGKKNRWGVPTFGSKDGLFEKSEIRWFTLDELLNMGVKKKRNIFNYETRQLINKIKVINWIARN